MYCKMPSAGSRSVEHVVPESLGNLTMILRPGIVCDACNNYFSRKVEGPFLNAPAMLWLRQEQGLTNKRGRVPAVRALVTSGGMASIYAATNDVPGRIEFDLDQFAHRWIDRGRNAPMVTYVPMDSPSATTTSRFLAKVAIGCLADRLDCVEGGLDRIVENDELDRLRDHARRGTDPHWPVSVRRIYPAHARWIEGDDATQKVWELDLFQDDDGYLYSVFVLFGIEYAIHLAEPDISSYCRWLSHHDDASPLYFGIHAADALTREGNFDHRY